MKLVVPFAAGPALDSAARTLQSIWTAHRWVATPSAMVNKGGGNGNPGWLYLSQHAKDARYLAVSTPR